MNLPILIVDDDPVSTTHLQGALKPLGCPIEWVNDGRKALAAIEARSYSSVILDVVMPGLSGMDVLRQIRAHRGRLELPIVMCTAREDDEAVIEALACGANDYLVKPINPAIARARLATQLDLVRLDHERITKERLAAINALIVTYNHEINNPLTVALGQLELMPSQLGLSEEQVRSLAPMTRALQRIADIVRAMRQALGRGLPTTSYMPGVQMIDLTPKPPQNS